MFKPDYQNLVDAARNKRPKRIPLYDHGIAVEILEAVSGQKFGHMYSTDKECFFKHYCNIQRDLGYDCVVFEAGITGILPYGGALAHPRPGYIDSTDKFESYPWDSVKDLYIAAYKPDFDALRRAMPSGMKAVGGVGYGVFEIAQDLCGYEGLCLLKYDEPELYTGIFQKVGKMMAEIWTWFLAEYPDVFCVVRFGDDLGYKSNTMLPAADIKEHIIPRYKTIVDLAHKADKPFILHSCGCIFSVMDEIISVAGIDAKHSNEDQIAPMSVWVEKYGGLIGNFGGIDTDHICSMDNVVLEKLVTDIYLLAESKNGGFAIGSGNSVPAYVNPEKYLIMNKTVRRLRGE